MSTPTGTDAAAATAIEMLADIRDSLVAHMPEECLFTDTSNADPVQEGINKYKKSSPKSLSHFETALEEIKASLIHAQSLFAESQYALTTLDTLIKKLQAFASSTFTAKFINEAINDLYFQSMAKNPPNRVLLVVPHVIGPAPDLTQIQTEFQDLRLSDPEAALQQALLGTFNF